MINWGFQTRSKYPRIIPLFIENYEIENDIPFSHISEKKKNLLFYGSKEEKIRILRNGAIPEQKFEEML